MYSQYIKRKPPNWKNFLFLIIYTSLHTIHQEKIDSNKKKRKEI